MYTACRKEAEDKLLDALQTSFESLSDGPKNASFIILECILTKVLQNGTLDALIDQNIDWWTEPSILKDIFETRRTQILQICQSFNDVLSEQERWTLVETRQVRRSWLFFPAFTPTHGTNFIVCAYLHTWRHRKLENTSTAIWECSYQISTFERAKVTKLLKTFIPLRRAIFKPNYIITVIQ